MQESVEELKGKIESLTRERDYYKAWRVNHGGGDMDKLVQNLTGKLGNLAN